MIPEYAIDAGMSGFTLFRTGAGWQAAVRLRSSGGWSVHYAKTAEEAVDLAFAHIASWDLA